MALNKKMYIGACLIAVSAIFLAACGDEITEVTEITQVVGMQVVEEGDALPKCNTENEGQMVYSVDSAAAYTCIGKKWVSMKGKDGADGKDGKDGTDGKDGENGKDGKNGKDGNDGSDGSDGKNCEIVSDTNGVTTLKCGDDTTTLYKAVCDSTPYDPMKQYCSIYGIFDLEKCGDKLYNSESHICDTRDSSLYRYVAIGSQLWMAENLNYKVDSSFCYNDSVEYCKKYGRLYKWVAAVGKSEEECGLGRTCVFSEKVRGVCPEGWHLPDNSEWMALFAIFGEIESGGTSVRAYWNETAGPALKSTLGWSDDGNGTDYFGFSALPAGARYRDGAFGSVGRFTAFWSSTDGGGDHVFVMDLGYNRYVAYLRNIDYKDYGYSVRCIKD